MKVKFKNWFCSLSFEKYRNGDTAIRLTSNGEPIAVATVCLPSVKAGDGYVFVKDYSENEGMLEALIEAKIVSEPVESIPSGFVYIYKCKLLVEPTG